METKTKVFLGVGVAIILVLILSSSGKPVSNFGSVAVSSEYIATTTAATASSQYGQINPNVLRAGPGVLGQVVVLVAGSAGGAIEIYDATTTNVNARTGQIATTSLLLASIPSNLAVGTYTFDAVARYGILTMTYGTIGTTTIMYR